MGWSEGDLGVWGGVRGIWGSGGVGMSLCPRRNLEEKRLLWRLLDVPGAPGQGGEAVPTLPGEQGPDLSPTDPPKRLRCPPQAVAGSRPAGSPSVGPVSPVRWLPSSAARAARCREWSWSWQAPGTACHWSRRGLLQVRLGGDPGVWGSLHHPLWPWGA